MIDADRYSITIQKVTAEGETCFRAQVRELPDVAAFGESHEEAYALAIDAIESLARTAEQKGKSFPSPLPDDEGPSGRVTLRLPKSIHARTIARAESERMSLNGYLVSVISYAVGQAEKPTVVAQHSAIVAGHPLEGTVVYGRRRPWSQITFAEGSGGATTGGGWVTAVGLPGAKRAPTWEILMYPYPPHARKSHG